ncbi:MAG: FlgD immunoglobulin-like domain containing protein [Candidatus Zixiibacteriota bacterium]
MSRTILAGLVVLAFVLLTSSALAECADPLSYEVVLSKSANTAQVKLYLENERGMAGASVPLSFASVGSNIVCERVDFEGSRVAHFILYPQIDNQNKRILIGMIRSLDQNISDVLPAGSGLIATLHFSSTNSRCVPELKMTPWPLSAGELDFDMVDDKGSSICRKKGETPIPITHGTSEPAEVQYAAFEVKGNFPNPFNPETVIKFHLPQASPVSLRVYNILGQVVNTLVDEPLSAGDHSVRWDGKNAQGRDVASGVYFYRINAGGYESIEKMTLLR